LPVSRQHPTWRDAIVARTAKRKRGTALASDRRKLPSRKDHTMFATYLVAFAAMLFAGISALTLIYAVGHLDSADAPGRPEAIREEVSV
jgi:hypothetical protein